MKKRFGSVGVGFLCFYVHFVNEVICFFLLGKYVGTGPELWAIFLFYDMLAFVPQGIVGAVGDRFPKLPLGAIGLSLISAALPLSAAVGSPYPSLAVLCLGNAAIHVDGAEATLRTAGGRLTPSAIFVAGGSFGVVTGQLLSAYAVPYPALAILALTAVPFSLLGNSLRREADADAVPCEKFDYAKKNAPPVLVILAIVFIIAARGYMSCAIPTSWKKEAWQTVLLFSAMGVGKALGGVLADLFGVRRVAAASAALALPFLLLGDSFVTVSLIGVMLFSMTMAVTLAVLVSVTPKAPGLAFGLTTIGLFAGTVPVFFFRPSSFRASCILISAVTAVCVALMFAVIRKDGEKNG